MRTKLFAVLGGLAALSVVLSAQTAFTSAGPVIVPASNSGASTDPNKRRVHTNLRYISIPQTAGAKVQPAARRRFPAIFTRRPHPSHASIISLAISAAAAAVTQM